MDNEMIQSSHKLILHVHGKDEETPDDYVEFYAVPHGKWEQDSLGDGTHYLTTFTHPEGHKIYVIADMRYDQ